MFTNPPDIGGRYSVLSCFGLVPAALGLGLDARLVLALARAYLAYDPAKRVLKRFDVVALGDVRGRPNGENIVAERNGEANPLGVAFELVLDPKPADYLPPRAARDEPAARPDVNLVERYLGLSKK